MVFWQFVRRLLDDNIRGLSRRQDETAKGRIELSVFGGLARRNRASSQARPTPDFSHFSRRVAKISE